MSDPAANANGNGARFRAYVAFLFRFKWVLLPLIVGAGVVVGSGGRLIEFKNDYRYFFREDNPQLQAFEELQEVYTKNDNILIVVAPKSGKVFEPTVIDAIARITDEGWQLPYATRVDSITNFQHTRAEEDDLIVADLVDADKDYTEAELAELRAIALAEPLLRRRLISDDASVTAVNVRHILPRKDSAEATRAALAARKLRDGIRADFPELSVYLTGNVMLSNSFFEASVQDLSTLVPLMYVVLLIVTVVFLRSLWGMVATLVVIALSAMTAMGLAGWLGIPITPPSSTAPTVILTLAVADSIHILVTMFQNMGKGLSKQEAMTESLRINMMPVFLTSLTTAIALLGLNMSDVRPFNDLGNIAAMGVGAAFVYSVTLLPVLVAILPVRARRKAEGQVPWMESFGEFVIKKRKPLLAIGAVSVLFLGFMATQNRLNDMFVEYFADSFEFRRDTDFVRDNLTGIYSLEFSIGSGDSGGISDPGYLQKLDEFSHWARSQKHIVHVSTLTDTFKRLNKNMHGDDPSYYTLPEERDLAAQYLLLYEMSLPYGLDLNDQIDVDKSSTRVAMVVDNVSAGEIRALDAAGQKWLQKNAPKEMHTVPASTSLMFSHISKRNIRSSIQATFIAMFLIAVILMFAFRSLKFGTISLIPNLVPALMAFGVWAIVDGEIDVGNATVATVSVGIIVDDTVHFLSKYLRARREGGLAPADAVRYAFSTVGAALVVTSFILVAGFAVLSLSPFGINAGMGQLTAIALLVALLVDLLFLPPLLMVLDRAPITADAEQPTLQTAQI